MFRSDKPVNYEEVYATLLEGLAVTDFKHAAGHLGAKPASGGVEFSIFGRNCLAGPDGIRAADGKTLDFTIRIVAAYYFIQAGQGEWTDRWVAYRDFKDGAFFHASFTQLVEQKIAQDFSGKLKELKDAITALGGKPLEAGLGGDLCYSLKALPQVPLALIFYDRDEDFPSSARVLFDSSAPLFLDMECLAVLGMILANQLERQRT